jgi:transposase
MLKAEELVPLDEVERQLYLELVPDDHFLRRLASLIDFERFREPLSWCYSSEQGRPALDPVAMLKLEIVSRHYNLSDREVVRQTQVNVAFRLFVGLSRRGSLPHHTSLTYFSSACGG